MSDDSPSQRKAQLDKAEREHLEDIVSEMRERCEDNVRFQLMQHDLADEPGDSDILDDDTRTLVEAIELEAVEGHTWDEAFEQYVTSVGYTIVNRIAALRCMEVRDFIDEEVTVFKENGLTPAAETLVHEEFLLEEEAILEAYRNTCDEMAEEIEILFDRSTSYSLVDPDDDTFEDLCTLLDEVPDEVWRADDVLGWVYEYYNVKLLDDLRRKGDRVGLDPEDVPPANQFYTPHWVVRMLTDNSLGKLYLEHTEELQNVVEAQEAFSPEERKNRPLSLDGSPGIADFCTYLVPSVEAGEPTDFDHPEELRVIDPACGSGHFLLYAFDVLERIWRAETDLPHAEIPRKILTHNLYGVDLDMRSCQLAAFNLYLKGWTRTESEGVNGFDMPQVGIVCADATVADIEGVEAVFDEVANGKPEVEDALRRILDAFEEVHGLGSLLDVRGTLGGLFEDDSDVDGVQLTLNDYSREDHTLSQILHSLREAVDQHRENDSFLAQDLRSFVRLLDVLAQDYDVALMNPPYGSRNRMPDSVTEYITTHYNYVPEYYISFFEVCERVIKDDGRIGMLTPRSFMFKNRFVEFRQDYIGGKGSFDFLAEYGTGILDNATVRTVGSIVRNQSSDQEESVFIRLYDVPASRKERIFTNILRSEHDSGEIKRRFSVPQVEFRNIPGMPICYSTPAEIRRLHNTDLKLDAEAARIDGPSLGTAANGMNTGDNDRFIRNHWEVNSDDNFVPYAKGGSDAWILPQVRKVLNWTDNGREVRRFNGSLLKNSEWYGQPGLTWTYIKETGRRFGYFPSGGVFDGTGSMHFSNYISDWIILPILNSTVYHCLFLSLTPERHWQVGDVGRIPWRTEFKDLDVASISKTQYSLLVEEQYSDPVSPYYIAPQLVPSTYASETFYDHPHVNQELLESEVRFRSGYDGSTITETVTNAIEIESRRRNQLERLAREIDQVLYDELEISPSTRQQITTEIHLRTGNGHEDRELLDPEDRDIPENLEQRVKDLVHHFAMEAAREESDSIIPVKCMNEQAGMLDRIIERFHDAYGEHAEDRLIEVNDILGTESAAEEAYPNLRSFLENDLFQYHVKTMENTPILWKLTTSRLVPDAKGEGFACFVDYHQFNANLFDRLSNQYLEPRKAELRERRSAANRRRSDDSLSTSEQAEATEQYERCTSALEQISVFEEVLQDLGDTTERDFDTANRQLSSDLAPKVERFRKETETRLHALSDLREVKGEEWFEDTFSPNFWNQIEEWREEWLDALEELEHTCDEYAKPTDEPVEAHLADLFEYFNWRLKGSDHYSSTGILFTTYYFEREGKDFLDANGEPKEGLQDEYAKRLATLAAGLDEYKVLADEIGEDCKTLTKAIPADWSDRAFSEITTAGYQPNRKHGVEINISPLADAEIVPKIVDDTVI